MEATRNWGLIYDWLGEVLDDVALAQALKVKANVEAKIKTDKISADILADLFRADLLPKAYAPGEQTRGLKSFLRQRMFIVWIQTMVKIESMTFWIAILKYSTKHPKPLSV